MHKQPNENKQYATKCNKVKTVHSDNKKEIRKPQLRQDYRVKMTLQDIKEKHNEIGWILTKKRYWWTIIHNALTDRIEHDSTNKKH